MKIRKSKDLILIGVLVLSLIVVISVGMYKDKRMVEQNKKDIETLKLNEEEKIKENTQYYLQKTLSKLDNDEDTMFMFVGDSVTCGSNATDQMSKSYTGLFANWLSEKFPNATVKLVRGKGITTFKPLYDFEEKTIQIGTKNTITVVNAGVWGDSMYQLYNRANNFISYKNQTPDCIFLMEGINDTQSGGKNRYTPANRFKELQESFIDYLQDKTNAEVAMMTSHWEGEKPDSPINNYVDAQIKIAKEKNLLLIDNKSVWDNHYNSKAENHGQGDWMTKDDPIHPTDIGHKAIFQNIVDNLYKTTVKSTDTVNLIKMDDSRISCEGNYQDVTITDNNSNASYEYKRITGTDSKINAKIEGNEIYAIVRDGKDSVTFNSNYGQDTKQSIKLGGSIYPEELSTVTNPDLDSAQHERVLICEGKNEEHDITLDNINGNLDIYGFETITYNK